MLKRDEPRAAIFPSPPAAAARRPEEEAGLSRSAHREPRGGRACPRALGLALATALAALALAACNKGELAPAESPPPQDPGTSGESCHLGVEKVMDNVAPSTSPPGGLAPASVPQFVVLGWDDNGSPEGLRWVLDLAKSRKNPDGSALRMSFYLTSSYADDAGELWKRAFAEGHELGNHTRSHAEALQHNESLERWQSEICDCQSRLSELGFPSDAVRGFRTPFLANSDATLTAVANAGFVYDCSLEEGYEDPTGRSYRWPYTLDGGSPGNELLVEPGNPDGKLPITPHPGLWELPVYALIAPPDDACEAYGTTPGLRARMLAKQSWFDAESGQVTGFDWNLWDKDSFEMSVPDVAATLQYSFDQHLLGNRAPMLFGTHPDLYGEPQDVPRRQAIEEFLDYVLTKPEVRVVSAAAVIDWMRAPTPLP